MQFPSKIWIVKKQTIFVSKVIPCVEPIFNVQTHTQRDHVAFVRLCQRRRRKHEVGQNHIYIYTIFCSLWKWIYIFFRFSIVYWMILASKWMSTKRTDQFDKSKKNTNNYDSCRFYYFRCCCCSGGSVHTYFFLPLHKNLCSLVTCPNVFTRYKLTC